MSLASHFYGLLLLDCDPPLPRMPSHSAMQDCDSSAHRLVDMESQTMTTSTQPVSRQARLHTVSLLPPSAPNNPPEPNIHNVDLPSVLTWKDQVTGYYVRILDGQVHGNPPSHCMQCTDTSISAKAYSIRISSSSRTASTEHLREGQYDFLQSFPRS